MSAGFIYTGEDARWLSQHKLDRVAEIPMAGLPHSLNAATSAAIAIYERVRSRGGRRHVADISKMVPVATAVVGVLAVLLLTGLWLDVTRPL